MPVRNRLDELIDYWDPQVKAAFLAGVRTLRDRAQLAQIIRMLEQGNVEGAIRAVGLDPTAFRPLDITVSRGFEATGEATARLIPPSYTADGFRTVFQFNIRNPLAEAWLANWAGTKIVQIIEDQRTMIRETLTDHLTKGNNPRTAALDIVGRIGPDGRRQGGMIGLTSTQAAWVRNYREELLSDTPLRALERNLRDRRFDRSVIRAARRGEPIDRDLVDDMVNAYQNRALRWRAETIARTETMAALHTAQQQAIDQAVEIGAVPPNAIGFIWRTAHDERVRESHVFMDGQRRALGEMFVSGLGNELEYPGDPNGPPEDVINCRCWREPHVDFLQGVE